MKFKRNFLKFTKTSIIIFAFFAVCIVYSFIEPYFIEEKINEVNDSDVPQSFVGKKIIFISDIHCGPFFTGERVAEVVRKVNELNPDIIILGGDYVYGDRKDIETCFEELAKLKAKTGILGVIGNHDEWEDYDLTVKCMKKAGITVLNDRAEWLRVNEDKIKIAGIDWHSIYEPDIDPLIEDAGENDFVILVSHTPDIAEKIKTDKIDLVLSGHMHGGQVTFFGLWALYVPSQYGQKYRTGVIKTDKTTVLVSNGIGNTFLPVRFFARPQINVVILRNEKTERFL